MSIIYSFYKKLCPKKINAYLFYFSFATFSFFASSALSYLLTGNTYIITQFCLVLFPFLWPIVYIWLSETFYYLYKESIKPLFFCDNPDNGVAWYKKHSKKMFHFSRGNCVITLTLWLISILTIYLMPDPFHNQYANLFGRIGFAIVLFIAVCSVYIIIYHWSILNKLTRIKVNADYFSKGYKYISQIKEHYIKCEIIITCAFFLVFIGINFSPFQINQFLLIWIVFIAMVPIGAFVITILAIKKITEKSKHQSIENVNSLIKVCLSSEDFKKSIKQITRLIEYRDYLESYRNKKIDISASFAFIATVSSIIAQILITILKT